MPRSKVKVIETRSDFGPMKLHHGICPCCGSKPKITTGDEGNPHYEFLKRLEFGGIGNKKSTQKMRGLLSKIGKEEVDESEPRDVLVKRCKDTYLEHIRKKSVLGEIAICLQNPENKPMCYNCTKIREEVAWSPLEPIFCQDERCVNFDERKWPQIYHMTSMEFAASATPKDVNFVPKKNQVVLFCFTK